MLRRSRPEEDPGSAGCPILESCRAGMEPEARAGNGDFKLSGYLNSPLGPLPLPS